jgi:antitoxin HicB
VAQEQQYEVALISQVEGGYVVSVPDLPDVVTEGETREEALAMAKDAIEGYLETMRENGWPLRTAEREHVTVRSA